MSKKYLTNSQLIEILRHLPLNELTQLHLFLQSPIFNTNQRALKLFESIRGRNKKKFPDFDQLDKEKLFYKAYPERKQYNAGTFKNLVSDLKKLTETYLAFSEYQKKTHLQPQFYLEGLLRFRIHDLFQKQQKNMLPAFECRVKDPETMLSEFFAKRTVHHHTTIHAPRNGNTSLQTMSEALDCFYISTKLKYLLGKYSWEHMTVINWKTAWLESELLSFLNAPPFGEIPIIHLYHQLVLLIKEDNQTIQFDAIREYLQTHETAFSDDESRQAYAVLLNYTRWQVKAGQTGFVQKAFEIYQYLLNNKILLVNGFLSPHHFNRIVEYGVQCEATPFFWTEQFLKGYQCKVDQKYLERVMPYNRAMLHFARKEYQKALNYLYKIYQEEEGFFDFYYNLMYRVLIIKIFFENFKAYKEQLITEVGKFRQYLNYHAEKDIALFEIEANQNFLNTIEKIIRKKQPLVKIELKELLEEIKNKKQLVEKIWLIEQIRS